MPANQPRTVEKDRLPAPASSFSSNVNGKKRSLMRPARGDGVKVLRNSAPAKFLCQISPSPLRSLVTVRSRSSPAGGSL